MAKVDLRLRGARRVHPRKSAMAAARAALKEARKAREASDVLPGTIDAAMDVDVDVPSDVDSLPSVPAAAGDFLAQLGPRRLPLRGAARAQPLGAPPGARPAPPAPSPRRSERVIVPRVHSSSEKEDSGATPSSGDEGAFVRRRNRQRVGKGPLRARAGASARARTRRARSRCRRPSRPSTTVASARRARTDAARCCGLARARCAAARARTSCSARSCTLTGWISSRCHT